MDHIMSYRLRLPNAFCGCKVSKLMDLFLIHWVLTQRRLQVLLVLGVVLWDSFLIHFKSTSSTRKEKSLTPELAGIILQPKRILRIIIEKSKIRERPPSNHLHV